MTDPDPRPPYLMPTDAESPLSRFRVGRYSRFDETETPCVFIHTGTGTLSFAEADAKALAYGLLAVCSGNFDLATTEEALRLEAEARARRSATAYSGTPTQTPKPLTPSLDDL